ncbi:NAD(P)H-flavin reductase [Azotobacter beijerinckii]|uniref:NAD(P)H-flavin reductase n=1 Tax=Azotobacter beijerinckii TaxID=170623 RepID=A0A1H6RG42_9GAMM|nr:FAD/NAD(P)-binding protein [Azotobacter beijerinckii]SEI54788.1 NAD(P)H-flavin reductase [Azotobacter beijerinckii]
MVSLVPRRMQLLEFHDEGEIARHFSFALESPRPGDQAVMPGQFFMLTVPGVGEVPFTYLSPPDWQGRFSALIRAEGAVSSALFELKPGARLGYRGPFGTGWPELWSARRVLAVAGGSGLAAMAGLIEALLRGGRQDALTLVYGARSRVHQVLPREREQWRGSLELVETLERAEDGRPGCTPLEPLPALFASLAPEAVLCCGPEPMMRNVAELCLAHNVPVTGIWLSMERRLECGMGRCGHCYVGRSSACQEGPVYRYDRYLDLLAEDEEVHRPC